jgi:hypothetical protein
MTTQPTLGETKAHALTTATRRLHPEKSVEGVGRTRRRIAAGG